MRRAGFDQRAAPALAHAFRATGAVRHGGAHELTGVVDHAEPALMQVGVHVLRRSAHARDLHVVQRRRAVQREMRHDAMLHQRDQARRHAHLDHVAAAHRHDGTPPGARGHGALDQRAQRLGGQLARQRLQHGLGGGRVQRAREVLHAHARGAIGDVTDRESAQIGLGVAAHPASVP